MLHIPCEMHVGKYKMPQMMQQDMLKLETVLVAPCIIPTLSVRRCLFDCWPQAGEALRCQRHKSQSNHACRTSSVVYVFACLPISFARIDMCSSVECDFRFTLKDLGLAMHNASKSNMSKKTKQSARFESRLAPVTWPTICDVYIDGLRHWCQNGLETITFR